MNQRRGVRRGSDWIRTKFRRSERIVRGFDGVRDYQNPPQLLREDIKTDGDRRDPFVRTSRQTAILAWGHQDRRRSLWKCHNCKLKVAGLYNCRNYNRGTYESTKIVISVMSYNPGTYESNKCVRGPNLVNTACPELYTSVSGLFKSILGARIVIAPSLKPREIDLFTKH